MFPGHSHAARPFIIAGLMWPLRTADISGPAAEAGNFAERPVVHASRAEAQAHLLIRAAADDPVPPGWEAHPVSLEELVLAYLREPGAAALPGPAREPSEVTR